MESICFIIIGGDVGATQYGADTRTVHILTAPLTLATGAVNRVQSVQLDKTTLNTHVVNVNIILKRVK